MATFYNSATLSYNGNVLNSNVISGEILEVLAATKTAVLGNYTANSDVTYVISLTNNGSADLTDLTLSDDLGAYAFASETRVPLEYIEGSILYYLNGAIQRAPVVNADVLLTISGITVPAGGNATIIYEARVNQFAPLAAESFIDNTVTITGDSIASPVTAEETITVQSSANLTINKSLSPSSVSVNGQLTYTFVIQNYGNTAATVADNAILSDTFNPILNPISVTFNGTPWTAPTNYTYDTATGEFATAAGQITVPAATFTQNPTSGVWTVNPGVSTLVVTGTV